MCETMRWSSVNWRQSSSLLILLPLAGITVSCCEPTAWLWLSWIKALKKKYSPDSVDTKEQHCQFYCNTTKKNTKIQMLKMLFVAVLGVELLVYSCCMKMSCDVCGHLSLTLQTLSCVETFWIKCLYIFTYKTRIKSLWDKAVLKDWQRHMLLQFVYV